MAYLRETKRDVDVDFSVEAIWQAIPKTVDRLDWAIQEKDEKKHSMTIRTEKTLTSYESDLRVELEATGQNSTHMAVYGQTPVTTITATLQFSQTDDCIEEFIFALAEIMNE